MVTYSYRCRQCGDFDVRMPMGEATGAWACPWCGTSAVRRFTAPQVRRGDVAVRRAYEYAERSADEPEVVSAPPPARPPRVSRDPRHARLPRP
ncbi:FmdB family zinc ribbon protein [Saccharomonospora viridis]|jgi:putative FmdB family regulatory protein|uniref:Putative regulatory protein, FmdB family n=1 Tax=Saccharomonospora viridis (strain ATCC 15386 / DSM 43017 / JCM 3036 / CCUG 5913 / NBRC 12207 / NCIMB 9602 / P101) TaxID=471857 RepID=C7MV35_SACVD|nr:zinc ribbon domain-containing protein [Saccharomonospora viridis]ACU96987.1 putative regulatory protein, FmdB family [Saccharomonospora viridis DSM 43017]